MDITRQNEELLRQLAEVSPTVVNGGDGLVQTRRGDAEPGDVQLQTVQGAALGEVDPSKQKIHLRPIEAIFKEFNPAGEKGLSSSRAKELLEIHGPNELEKPPRISLFMLSSSSSTL